MRKRDIDSIVKVLNTNRSSKFKIYISKDDFTGYHLIRYARNGERICAGKTWDIIYNFLNGKIREEKKS